MSEINKVDSLIKYYNGDELAARVLADKYLKEDETSPEEMWRRLAIEISEQEDINKAGKKIWEERYYDLLSDFKFIPGGRIMYALGRDENVSCTNCYVIPIKEDSIEGIYDWLKESALTYRSTGGVGTDISILRPKGMPVKNSGGNSPGACSFMDLMSQSTNTVHQKLRRGALMITINVHHPDVLEFIDIKKILGKIEYEEGQGNGYNNLYKLVEHANISVQLTDEFLQALEDEGRYEQRWPVDSNNPSVSQKVSAKKVWDAIIKNAHAHAEPGIFFVDNHKRNDALAYANPALTTNPCGEQFLGPYANCLLGHMNLDRYVERQPDEFPTTRVFHFDKFADDIKTAVRFLDNCITWNDGKHALPEQNEIAVNERRIGLGITGLGDALIRLRVKYDSEEALEVVERIMHTYRDAAYNASIELAKAKGSFPLFDIEKWGQSEFVANMISELDESMFDMLNKTGIRNSFLLTMAPVGSGSIIGQVSSGIEPIFATSYTRRVREQDGETFKEYKTYPRIIEEVFNNDNNLPNFVVTAHKIDPYFRVKLQSVIQKYVDNSISSTVNLPKETPEDTIAQIYLDAWRNGLKSITVYREGSREGVLITDDGKSNKKKEKEEPQKRPVELGGVTYKIPSGVDEKLYITINPYSEDPKKPYEVFINTFGEESSETKALAVLVSALLKNVDDIDFIIEHLSKITSSADPVFWHDKDAQRRHQITTRSQAVAIALQKFTTISKKNDGEEKNYEDGVNLEKCPKCGSNSYKNENGCGSCLDCGYSKCN